LVADHREGDLAGAVGQRAGDDAAGFAAFTQRGGVAAGGGVFLPQADAQAEQGAAQVDRAFPADAPVAAPPGRCPDDRGQPGRAIDLGRAAPV
jgi:hypothetical protein